MDVHREALILNITWGIVQRIISYILACFHVARYISKTKPDIIITQQVIATPTTLISKLFRIPVIVIVRDYWPVCYYRSLMKTDGQICYFYDKCLKEMANCAESNIAPNRNRVSIIARLFSLAMYTNSVLGKYVISKANAIVAISNFVKRTLTENGYNPESIRVIYNPVSATPEAASYEGGASSSAILFVGSLDLKKGIQTLIEAMPSVTKRAGNAQLIVVGETKSNVVGKTPEKIYLENLVSSLGVGAHVKFLGRVDNKTLGKLYQQCALVVVPSLWPEPFGRVIVEALMHSRPVVAFSVGGIPELVSRNTGILVSRGDKSGLADAIASIIAKRTPLKFDASATHKFSAETICMQYLSLIESVRYGKRGEGQR
jgi:glycosyltransferase involved in cell wall biosynthesis